jgi:GNAT superfamily N-acetyltransferase
VPSRFRLAATEDVELLIALMREFYAGERYPFAERAARHALGELLADPRLGRAWVIEEGGAALGYAVVTLGFSLEYQGRDAFVDELYVCPAQRGRGLGRAAMEHVEAECRALGVRALHLEVERTNPEGRALYRRRGFRDNERHLLTKWLVERERG